MTDNEPTPPPARAAAPKRRLDPATPEVAEVVGHGFVPSPEPARDASSAGEEVSAEGEAEVSGQMHPHLAQCYAESRRQEMRAEAERGRRPDEARADRGGGVLDRLRGRGDKGP